ncbi:MAG: M20/M25/M40 family metallo-hydrolase [Firmicutes bacterium]|nr:M20/M25/M40 family metallo-hydrolase [Bacillota bacterium]
MEEIVAEFCQLVQIDSASGREGAIAQAVEDKLRELGFSVERDEAGEHFGGETGNIIAKLPGEGRPILLSAHLDRVQPGLGIKPVVKDGRIVAGGDTILAADDVAGIVAILAGVRQAKLSREKLPPLEVVFTVFEEGGLLGSRYLDYERLESTIGFVLDAARPVGTIINQAPTQFKFDVAVLGRAAHAAGAPEEGISAIQVAARAVAELPFGRIDGATTANIGKFKGETATNIVCDRVEIQGEIRSLDENRAEELLREFSRTFTQAAASFGAEVDLHSVRTYQGFKLDEEGETVLRAKRALAKTGRTPTIECSMGGSDANNFNRHGIAAVNLGVGYEKSHSTRESIAIDELVAATRLVCQLILEPADVVQD